MPPELNIHPARLPANASRPCVPHRAIVSERGPPRAFLTEEDGNRQEFIRMIMRERIRSTWTLAALVAACVFLVGCGEDSPTEPNGGDPPGGDPPGGDPPGGDPPGGDPPSAFVRVATGAGHSCALDDDGVVWCWGRNLEGQLGLGDTEGVDVFAPMAIESDVTFVSIGAGEFHTCALDDTGAAYCWGANVEGQVGDGTFEARDVPVPVAGGHVFTGLAVGGSHTCGIVSSTEGYCWGDDSFGQLGNASSGSSNVPVEIMRALENDDVIQLATITAGGGHTCVLDDTAAPFCWGNNGTGQLGDGGTTSSEVPVAVSGGGAFDFVAVTAGTSHTCATAGGQADCWGFNLFGQLGDGTNVDKLEPGAPGVLGVELAALSAGADHTCGLDPDGVAYCWGFNTDGRLGDGTETDRNQPTPVSGGLAFADVSAGILHTCGATTDGDVFCWGQNLEGQLGDGSTEGSLDPVQASRP
jgi:alpha-tubulin suppressor-like RCC1 family protein